MKVFEMPNVCVHQLIDGRDKSTSFLYLPDVEVETRLVGSLWPNAVKLKLMLFWRVYDDIIVLAGSILHHGPVRQASWLDLGSVTVCLALNP